MPFRFENIIPDEFEGSVVIHSSMIECLPRISFCCLMGSDLQTKTRENTSGHTIRDELHMHVAAAVHPREAYQSCWARTCAS